MERSQTNTDRNRPEQNDRKYWYTLVAFIVATTGSMTYVVLVTNLLGRESVQGTFLTLWVLGLLVLGLVAYVALFKDTAFVRSLNHEWQPKSWYYFVFNFGVPIIALIAGSIGYQPTVGLLLAIISFILATFCTSVYYLYRRRSYLGRP